MGMTRRKLNPAPPPKRGPRPAQWHYVVYETRSDGTHKAVGEPFDNSAMASLNVQCWNAESGTAAFSFRCESVPK